jgi:hypothetical protein
VRELFGHDSEVLEALFSLLVGIDPHRGGRFSCDRVLTHTDSEAQKLFMPQGQLSREILKLPAILMEEDSRLTSSHPTQLAYVGRVHDFVQGPSDIDFKCGPDALLPPIPVRPTLKDMSTELGIKDWELCRTHWAVKTADLFETLFRFSLKDAQKPRIHGIDRLLPIDPDQVSVMIRFRPDFDEVFDVLKEAAESLKFKCQRVKDIWEKDAIITDTASLIMRSRVVIADLTDRNANVFYECGFAHGVGRDVIPITQDAADNFDVQHLRHIVYQNTGLGRESLGKQISARLAAFRNIV